MSYINVNNIYSLTNPYNSINPGVIKIPFSPIQQGLNSFALGRGSHAEGQQTEAYGLSSHAEGWKTDAFGDYSHSEGIETEALAYGSHAEGYRTEVVSGATGIGWYSHAEGGFTKAFGTYSHSEGSSTEAIANISHAEGKSTKASGIASHSEGSNTIAIGRYSHSEGINTVASGETSHAEGNFSKAIGYGSHAEGYTTTANGDYSHSQGYWTTTNASYQTVVGKYNSPSNTQGAFIVGNGVANNVLTNLLVAAGNEVEVFGNTKTETIQITDGATAGYVLTSDASGNGTWQSVAGASDTYVISSTLNGTDLEINRNNGQPQISVDLSSLTSVDTFVTGSTLNGTTLEINRNQGEPQISVDLSPFADDTIVTGFTYSNNNLTISQNGQSDLTTNISVMTGVTVNGPADFTDEVLINSTTLFGQTTWNPTGVSRASHRIDGNVTPTLSDGTNGQLLHIFVADVLSFGTSTVTVTSSLGFNTIQFNSLGDTVTLMFNQGFGWTIVGSHSVTIS